MDLSAMKWPESGLLPAIAQDAGTGEVLTLAWQNRDALEETLTTGFVHYWSRSRQALWKKGETSGHTQKVLDVRMDCDLDAILMAVEPAGPACHTGKRGCFFNRLDATGVATEEEINPWPAQDILARLQDIIDDRRQSSAEKSYVRTLLDDQAKAAEKVREESGELIDAVDRESGDRVASEAADLIFHALVLAEGRGVDWSQIAAVLEERFGVSGHVEKASRGQTKHAVGNNKTTE